ncbi:MAG TPA: radical SAM protein [Terriglobales bacterium]|nr:radical SAM protein [Terriglobales bacterium]
MATLPLLQDDENRPQLVGIARLAANGEHIRDGHNIEYLTINTRSILNRCNVPRMPFSWTVNPYRGCEFACKYCYARYTHEFMELRDPLAFEQKIYVKQNVAAQLHRDLKKVKKTELIAIGTATDPYQPAERRYELTRAILEEFANHEGYDIGIVTKSNLVVRDADVLRRIGERNKIYVNVTVTTLDHRLAHLLEPRAPRPDLRLAAVHDLNVAGVPAGVICAPVLPGITDGVRELDALVQAAKQHGALYIHANPLFLKPCSAAVFLPFLEKEFPHLVKPYRERYGEKAFVSPAYARRLSLLMAKLRAKHGFPGRRDHFPRKGDSVGNQLIQHGQDSEQMSLFAKPA